MHHKRFFSIGHNVKKGLFLNVSVNEPKMLHSSFQKLNMSWYIHKSYINYMTIPIYLGELEQGQTSHSQSEFMSNFRLHWNVLK